MYLAHKGYTDNMNTRRHLEICMYKKKHKIYIYYTAYRRTITFNTAMFRELSYSYMLINPVNISPKNREKIRISVLFRNNIMNISSPAELQSPRNEDRRREPVREKEGRKEGEKERESRIGEHEKGEMIKEPY